jgi:hypothetical protein
MNVFSSIIVPLNRKEKWDSVIRAYNLKQENI